ncbi:MAG: metallophosphoesterase [Acidobacteriota bacterium]
MTKRRVLGIGIMALGVTVTLAPIFFGEWTIALLGIALIAAGLLQFVGTFRSNDREQSTLSYAAGVVTTVLGCLLFMSPNLAISAVSFGVTLFFLGDGGFKLYTAYQQNGQERRWSIFNGIFTITIGCLIWFFISAELGILAIGIVLGLRLIVEGWTMVFLPEKGFESSDLKPDMSVHPDARLGVESNNYIKNIQEEIKPTFAQQNGNNIFWCLSFLGIFFLIHLLRTDAQWSFIGFISPFTAVVGDAVVALLLAIILILPLRLLWRKLTRPLERIAWHRLFILEAEAGEHSVAERFLQFWLTTRMRFALEMREMRNSLNFAFWRVLRFGLPLTAILIAVNSIWGFSWYFNSENWASGVWQEITKNRIVVWRQRMAEDVERDALAKGVAPEKVFAIEPEGVTDEGDFSFVVIGDTGEGDASQLSLHDQIIAANNGDGVKFLVLSSDIIYPDGKMKDYERNFYLPFKGFEKPFYAIPGNHDWFDANEGFNANFMTLDAAQISLRSRLAADLQTNAVTTDKRFDEITAEAARLRAYYKVKNGLQRSPYFEMHTEAFSLLAVDTGILRKIDPKQKAWLESALARSGDNYKLVVLGHPFYVGGEYIAKDDKDFDEIYQILQRYNVNAVMAGDTHDFEFYKIKNGGKEMLSFVNGGGGAYLSIGTSLGFPDNPVTNDYAFYPRTDELTTKIHDESPFWKMPFYWWLKWFRGYPFDEEMVSGAFDFNRSPFFQSFLEVAVERSKNQVRFILYGANGRLRWRDIQTSGAVKPAEKSDDDFVEFVAPLAE